MRLAIAVFALTSLLSCNPGDAQPGPDAGDPEAGFACGPELRCEVGQYCSEVAPGACIGDPVPEDGCAAGCEAKLCHGQMVCLCTGYGCVALPDDCVGCECFAGNRACTCRDDGDGALYVACVLR